MTLLIAFLLVSICISFLCSILEAVLLSVTPSYIASLRETRPQVQHQLQILKERIDQPLAAILTLNTIAHTFGAAGVGAQVGVVFGDGYLALASAIMTFLVLILSEIIPKSLGARHWGTLAPFLPYFLQPLIIIMKPFIKLSDLVTGNASAGVPPTDLRAEIKALTRLGREAQQLDESEQRVISNILDLHEVKVKGIMTPAAVCQYMLLDSTVADIQTQLHDTAFSRYPVLDSEGHPHGMVFRTDLLKAEAQTPLKDLMTPTRIFTDETSVEEVLDTLLAEHQHLSLVYDEYGTWMGIVTMEDILETILGQAIMDETDDIPNMRRHARKRWEHRLRNR